MSGGADTAGEVHRIEVSPYLIRPGTVITARSYLIDRMVPDCEVIALPPREMPGGEITFRRADRLPAPPRETGLRASLRRLKRGARATEPVQLDGSLGVDFRLKSPANWSHFLNQHLPLATLMTHRLGLTPSSLTLILPADIPGYVLRAAAHLGFLTQATDGAVEGPGLTFTLTGNVFRPQRRDWLLAAGTIDMLYPGQDNAEYPLPRRVFMARQDTRQLTNQPEIEALLNTLGFQTLYPEKLSVADQFRLFNTAEAVVAVHGAGLAPLLYRHPDSPLRKLVELLPVGHMTDVFRSMAQQVGCDWIGVRGRIKPQYIRPAYALGQNFTRFSLDGFEIDPVSLDRALAAIGISPTG